MAIEEERPERTTARLPDGKRRAIERIDELLDEGELPGMIFNDPEVHELEMDRVIGDTWNFVGHESEIPAPGDYTRRYVGDTPVIFTRDESGDVQVLFDSCRHRGTKVCRAEEGNTSHFRCPYHGWTYNNKGELVGVPQKHKALRDLDPAEYSLHKPTFDSYEGFVFATLDDGAPSLDDYLGDFAWYLDIPFKLADWEVYGQPQRYEVNAPWVVGAENFAGDDYHVQPTHQSSIEAGFVDPTHVEAHQRGNRVNVNFTDGAELGHNADFDVIDWGGESPELYFGFSDEVKERFSTDDLTEEQARVARHSIIGYGNVFPNCSFLVMPIGNSRTVNAFFHVKKWRPIGPGEMEIWYWFLVPRDLPEELKEEVYEVGVSTFIPAGTWEPDDLAVWEGISETTGSTFTRKRDAKLAFSMGLEKGMSEVERDSSDWEGPGTITFSSYDETYARTFYRRWHREMTKEPL